MALTSKIFLDPRYTKKNGEKSIIIRITIDRKLLEISTGYTVLPKDWNDRKSEIKTSCKTIGAIARTNNLIHRKRQDALEKIIALQDSGRISQMTIKQIRDHILDKRKEVHIIDYTNSLIEQMKQAGQVGNATV